MGRPKVEESRKCIRKDISMEPEQYQKLCNYCLQEERPMSWVIRKALDEYLNKVA